MLKKVRLTIATERVTAAGSLFADEGVKTLCAPEMPRREVTSAEGNYLDDGARVSIAYTEDESSGLSGSRVTISFLKNAPETVTMGRSGGVRTLLTFEENTRCYGVYETPIMRFDVCVYTEKAVNAIERDGTLTLDYAVELKGAEPEHVRLALTILPGRESEGKQ